MIENSAPRNAGIMAIPSPIGTAHLVKAPSGLSHCGSTDISLFAPSRVLTLGYTTSSVVAMLDEVPKAGTAPGNRSDYTVAC